MSFVAQIDEAGHLRLPEELLGKLQPGALVRVDVSDSGPEPLLRFESDAASGELIDEDGLLVWRSSGPDEPDIDRKILLAIRHERDLRNGGVFAETMD